MKKSLKTNLSSEVANIIRKNILLGIYTPNQHLTETSLAEELGISRGPIREAMMILENEGFIYTPPNGRKTVIGFNENDVEDYHELRFNLEVMAIKKVINKSYDSKDYEQWIEEIYSYLKLMKRYFKEDNSDMANEYDYLFHESIIKRSNNKALLRVWSMISGIRRSIMQINENELRQDSLLTYDEFVNMHINIFNGLKDRKVEYTKEWLYNHLALGTKIYKNILQQIKDQPINY